jgi:hypothetical protein
MLRIEPVDGRPIMSGHANNIAIVTSACLVSSYCYHSATLPCSTCDNLNSECPDRACSVVHVPCTPLVLSLVSSYQ